TYIAPGMTGVMFLTPGMPGAICRPMLECLKNWFASSRHRAALNERLEKLRRRAPIPVIWLFGKTQSGKTSIIKYLTGADDAEVGEGFRPCTRFSREFQFPTPEA